MSTSQDAKKQERDWHNRNSNSWQPAADSSSSNSREAAAAAAALQRRRERGLREARGRDKKDDKEVHRLQLYEVKKGELLVPQEKAKEKFERALDRVPVLVRGVQGGRFPAETPPTCDCPSWCHGSDICRSIRQSKAWRP